MKGGTKLKRLRLGVFASGRGSNFEAIVKNIKRGSLSADVKLLITNNQEAGALRIAKRNGIDFVIISKKDFKTRDCFVEAILSVLEAHRVDFIALAGYMKKVPAEVISRYRNRIVNIHPALLPAFGGRGMYGKHVHQAVLDMGCKVTGVTVHIVDEIYDHGPIVAQRCVAVKEGDTPETLAARVLRVEHELYSQAIQLFAEGRVEFVGGKVVIRE